MAQREIRYCTTADGARIAYCVEGDAGAATTLLALPAFNETFSLDHLMPVYQQFYRDLGRGRRVVRFDWRGHGLSTTSATLPEDVWADGVEDLLAVASAIGSELTLWASTIAGPAALHFAIKHPNLVQRVILYGAYADPVDAIDQSMLSAIGTLVAANWKVAMQTVADLNGRRDFPIEAAELGEWYARSESQDHYVMRNLRFQATEHRDRPDLSRVSAPCLVMHRMGDPAIRFQAGQVLAAGLPNCRFIPLAGDRHLFCLGDYGDILSAVDEFIGDRAAEARTSQPPLQQGERGSAASGTAIILFTDIADSTALTERMGDARFREASRALDAALRTAIREAGGDAIDGKLLGDGVLATFGSAAQAIDGARRCLALSAAAELGLHIGLHAGDVIREEIDGRRDVFGGAVNIASRICGLSAPGEILVSDVVRGMGRSSAGVEFVDRGEHEMKGVGEAVRVYAVRGDV